MRLKYANTHFDQDKAAQQVFAFAMDARNMQNGNVPEICNHCGGSLKVYYCEDQLYLVRCLGCHTAALTIANDPRHAAQKTIGG